MKNVFLLYFIFSFIDSFGQVLPSDSLILRSIYGKSDIYGLEYGNKFKENGTRFSNKPNIVFRIVFKEIVNLDNKEIILTIIEGKSSRLHGHQFGFRNYYFLTLSDNVIEIADSITSFEEIPLGDNSAFEITDIGKDKKVLITTYQSTGNSHFEKNQEFHLLQLGKLEFLLAINSEYDNSAWKTINQETDDCNAQKHQESFEIVRDDSEWYRINVHRLDFEFAKGCKDSYIKKESFKNYRFINGRFTEEK
jgi:hypothetical protein